MHKESDGSSIGPDYPGYDRREDASEAIIDRGIARKCFLQLSGAGIAGALLVGSLPGSVGGFPLGPSVAIAQDGGDEIPALPADLVREFEEAAREYGVPAEVLAAMGYANTRWEMPPPELSAYEDGDPHGWGGYGIMALVQNPSTNTLGEASELTGISEEELKTDRRSNILGGAALLARSQGKPDPEKPVEWTPKVGAGPPSTEAPAGVGGGELYAGQVAEAMSRGAGAGLSSGGRSTRRSSRNSRDGGES